MNCSEIQEQLFAADSLTEGTMLPDLASHLRDCADCEALRSKLARIEAATLALPALSADEAKQNMLRQLQPRRPATRRLESPLRLLMRRGWPAKAVAAAVLILVGGTLWLGTLRNRRQLAQTNGGAALSTGSTGSRQAGSAQGQPVDSSVVDKLVDMNLDLSDATTPAERNQIFAEQAAPLTATLNQDHLAPKERELASTLLENGKWLSSHTDPLDEAERFDNVAGLLFDRLQDAAPAGDVKAISRLARRYGLVAARLEEARGKLARAATLSPERKRRYERLVGRQSEVEQQLQELLQRAPEMSRKEIRKELENIGKAGKKKRSGK